MSEIPTSVLVAVLVLLIALSAFFSGSETGMMALNRYRLRHLAANRHRGRLGRPHAAWARCLARTASAHNAGGGAAGGVPCGRPAVLGP